MTKLFNNFFLITYSFYKKWDKLDPFFDACFAISVIWGTVGFPKNRTVVNSKLLTLNKTVKYENK